MISQDLILKYHKIKESPIQSFEQAVQQSSEIAILARLAHDFCHKDFFALSVSADILEIVEEGKSKLDSVVECSGNYLIVKHNNLDEKFFLKHSIELVNIFDDGSLSEDEKSFLELYFSEPDFFIFLNLGLKN